MQKNIGTIDAILRITCGLAMLAWCASRSRREFPCFIAIVSAMKVAEGITRFCPILFLLNKNSLSLSLFGLGKSPE